MIKQAFDILNNLNQLLASTSIDNWDGNGAKAITKQVGDKVHEFITNLDIVLPMPLIKPMLDNSINISWENIQPGNRTIDFNFNESDLCTVSITENDDNRIYTFPDDIIHESSKIQSILSSDYSNKYIVTIDNYCDCLYFYFSGL